MKRITWIWLTALCLSATAVSAQPQEGDLVANFTLEKARGGLVSLHEHQGKAVMLFFFGYN
ncbi:MAG: hypothetical protein GKR89_04870 [Candidatus Latescibacteria bacterium]|nr:hypothetical protein [Candidatus Latescibacterota bacterium]